MFAIKRDTYHTIFHNSKDEYAMRYDGCTRRLLLIKGVTKSNRR